MSAAKQEQQVPVDILRNALQEIRNSAHRHSAWWASELAVKALTEYSHAAAHCAAEQQQHICGLEGFNPAVDTCRGCAHKKGSHVLQSVPKPEVRGLPDSAVVSTTDSTPARDSLELPQASQGHDEPHDAKAGEVKENLRELEIIIDRVTDGRERDECFQLIDAIRARLAAEQQLVPISDKTMLQAAEMDKTALRQQVARLEDEASMLRQTVKRLAAEQGRERESTIVGSKVISKPGAAIEVTQIKLSEKARRALTTCAPLIPAARPASPEAEQKAKNGVSCTCESPIPILGLFKHEPEQFRCARCQRVTDAEPVGCCESDKHDFNALSGELECRKCGYKPYLDKPPETTHELGRNVCDPEDKSHPPKAIGIASSPAPDIARLRELLTRITEGPWSREYLPRPYTGARVVGPEEADGVEESCKVVVAEHSSAFDAEFIALSRVAVPYFLAHLELVERENNQFRQDYAALLERLERAETLLKDIWALKPDVRTHEKECEMGKFNEDCITCCVRKALGWEWK